MSRELRIRVRAEFDLDELVDYIARRDRRAALRFRSRSPGGFRGGATGRSGSRSLGPGPGRQVRLRQILRYPKFVVIYEVTDQRIDILRVVRGSRNLDVFLPD